MEVEEIRVQRILTRSSGYLLNVSSHSLNPYRGCSLGQSLCGVACYVQHNPFVTRGRPWGSFLEAKVNAAERYGLEAEGERRWARRKGLPFSLFLASSTDPFLPQEARLGITASLLQAFLQSPPDVLIVQTHSALVVNAQQALVQLSRRCQLRVHITVEGDRERLTGLPPPGFSLERRLQAAQQLHQAGLRVVATLAPLFPLENPQTFFRRLGECVSAVVIDHFIGGDGSPGGHRTRRTRLPAAMESVHPGSTRLDYQDAVVQWARQYFPGQVGVGSAGFAGQYLP